jgi:Uma2 family endonuclease
MVSFEAIYDHDELPAVDDNLLADDAPYEIYDGELVAVAPALEPHGSRHSKVAALLEAHAGPAFKVACELLIRTSHDSNFAPDASVFPRARDPETGGRQLEHLAFEVAVTESLGHAGRKAAKLTARGVRRVFAIESRAFVCSSGRWPPPGGSSSIQVARSTIRRSPPGCRSRRCSTRPRSMTRSPARW